MEHLNEHGGRDVQRSSKKALEQDQIPGLPEMSPEQLETKAYTIGTISIDKDGIFHAHYIGHHDVMGKKYFGNGVVSMRNIRQLLDTLGSRLNKKKDVYTEKIKEIENAKTNDDGSRL